MVLVALAQYVCKILSSQLRSEAELKAVSKASLLRILSPHIPLEVPLSISELALRPLMPRLLLLAPSPPPFLISLFLRIIGVSAKGRAIFVPSLEASRLCTGVCNRSPTKSIRSSSSCWIAGCLPFFDFAATGSLGLFFGFESSSVGTTLLSLLCRVLFLLGGASPFSARSELLGSADFFRDFFTGNGLESSRRSSTTTSGTLTA